jgi:hypothetical protein
MGAAYRATGIRCRTLRFAQEARARLRSERRVDRAVVQRSPSTSAELKESETALTTANDLAIRHAFEPAGIEFIYECGGGPGVRLRRRHQKKS